MPGADASFPTSLLFGDRAPLVIGVTGHRDPLPEAVPDLEKAVDELFGRLWGTYPNTPLLVLSALAEGADQIVARRALAAAEAGQDVAFVAVLPMPLEHYRADFEGAAREEFEELLGRSAIPPIELPLLAAAEEVDAGGEIRSRQYAFLGAFLARYSQILLALWDGERSSKTGGTAQVVSLAETGRFSSPGARELHRCLDKAAVELGFQRGSFEAQSTAVLHHIPTPRLEPGSKVGPQRHGFKSRLDFGRIDELNHDLERQTPAISAQREESAEGLMPKEFAGTLDRSLQELRRLYAAVDALALHFQQCTRVGLDVFLFLIFVAASVFSWYSTILVAPSASPISLALYLFVLTVAGSVFFFIKKHRYEDKYLDYRAVAEGLRIQFFVWLAGFPLSVADRYLRWQHSELEWIRSVIKSRETMAGASTRAARLELVKTYWLDAQLEYFEDQAYKKKNLRHLAIDRTLLLGSLGLAMLEALRASVYWRAPGGPLIESYWAFFGLAFFLGGILLLITQYASQLHDYRILADSLKAGALRLGAILLFLLLIRFVLLPVLERMGWLMSETWYGDWTHWIILAIVVSALIAGLLRARAGVRAESDEARQYERMKLIYAGAMDQFLTLQNQEVEDTGRQQQWLDLIEEVAREALAENGEWVLMHRNRPIEMSPQA